jgi:hypothetical protein
MNLYLGALLFYSVFLMALGLFISSYPREAQNNLAFAGSPMRDNPGIKCPHFPRT